MQNTNFNTSHVTVYPDRAALLWCAIEFQYISCYCLSVTEDQVYQGVTHFNTSHVTVYLEEHIETDLAP